MLLEHTDTSLRFLDGGGEMGALMRSKNWDGTSLGNPAGWPQSLRTTLSIILNSKFPMFLWWGTDLICFYNDAYRPSLGEKGKHPAILGEKAADYWQEIWHIIYPQIEQVMTTGEATWNEDMLVPIYRNGSLENVYWTYSYSPVTSEEGNINGVLVVCNETTGKIARLKKLGDSEQNFRNLVKEAPIATSVFIGKDYTIELANDEALKLWGKDKSVLGKKLLDALPELAGQPYIGILDQVFSTGITYEGKADLAYLIVDGVEKEVYVNFIYKALHNTSGDVYAILCMGYDVTSQVESKNKLADAEERGRLAIEAAELGTFDVDILTDAIVSSSRLFEIFGVKADGNVRSQDLVKAIHKDDLPIRAAAFVQLYEEGSLNYDARVIWPDNTLHWINAQGKLYYDKTGKPIRILGTVKDITLQKEAELELRKSEQRFRDTVTQAPVGIVILRGENFMVEMANAAYLALVDRKEDYFVGRPLFHSLPEAEEHVEPILTGILKTGRPYYGVEFEVPLVRHGKTETSYFNFVYQPLQERNGSVNGIIAVATEVTAQVKARHDLEESGKQFRNLVMQSPVPMAILRGAEFVIDMANQTMLEQIWQLSFDEVRGKKLLDVFPELKDQQFAAQLQTVFNTGISIQERESLAYLNKPGGVKRLYVDFEYAPLFEADKAIAGLIVTLNDVTERVEARQQLKEAADRLQMATDGSQVATWDLDLQSRHIIYSPQLALIFGHTEHAKLTHQQLRNHIHPQDLPVVENAFSEALQSGVYSYEARIIYPNKNIRWIKTLGKVVFADDKTPLRILGTMMDITERKDTEENLQKLAAIVQSSGDAIIGKRLDGVITSWNDAAEKVFGYTADEMIGQQIFKLIPDDRKQEESEIIARLKSGQMVEHFETIRVTKEGRRLNISLTISPLKDAHGNVIGASKIARDVTAQRLAEKRIIENEERLQIVVEASELGTWELDLRSMDFTYSARYAEIFGYSSHVSFYHADFLKHMHPDDLATREHAFKTAFETGILDYVSRIIWRDNTIHWIEAKGKVFYNDENQPFKLVGTVRDITEEKFYQHRMEESERRFRSVADTAPVLIWMAGTDKSCHFFNKAWLNFTGRTMEQEYGNGWSEGVHPDDFQNCLDTYVSNFDLQREFYMEYRLKRHDGEYRWISDNGVPRFTPDGVFEGFIGACMDIHDRILFEEKLKESESRLRIAAMSSELGTWDYNPVTDLLVFDNASRELFGIDGSAYVSMDLFFSKMHPDDRETTRQKIARTLNPDIAEPYDAEYRVIGLPNDKIRWIHAKGKAFFDEHGTPRMFAGTVLDITEKRLALEELQESELKFRLLADSMPQFIWTGDSEGNLNYFNKAVYKYSGFTPAQMLASGWLEIVHPDDRPKNIEKWLHSVKTGEHFLFEHRFKRYDGEYRWQLSRAIPQKDAEGNIQMWVGSSTDIHDRKLFTDELESKVRQRTAELHTLNENLVKSNAELAQFAYVASHDLQEPLRKIQTFATRLLDFENQNLSDKGKDYFARMQSAAKRMQQLIVDLLSYSRANTAEKHTEKTNLNSILQTVTEQLRDTIDQKQASIESEELPTLNVITYQLEQLFTNIIGNALKFSRAGVPPVIKINSRFVPGSELDIVGADAAATYVHIRIADNGIGFEPQFSERIFQVFQRLHGREEYAGTGIGLAICKKIVENHQGFINAKGVVGEGSVFNIYLPVE
jgi:PAS domain S-box-containing protein